MLNKELEFTLNVAFKEAREKRHEFMTVEHLHKIQLPPMFYVLAVQI